MRWAMKRCSPSVASRTADDATSVRPSAADARTSHVQRRASVSAGALGSPARDESHTPTAPIKRDVASGAAPNSWTCGAYGTVHGRMANTAAMATATSAGPQLNRTRSRTGDCLDWL